MRVDFNVESAEDSLRLEESLPTIKFLLERGARVLLLSHRGRPNTSIKYKVVSSKYFDSELSLRVFIPFLHKNLREKIIYLNGIPDKLPDGKVFLLENLRFWPEEEANDMEFAHRIAQLGDFYVNDAFAVCHRENASVTQLPKLLPSYAGLLLEKEISTLSAVMKKAEKPLVLIFGGAKIEDKLPIIENLLPKTESVLLGSSALYDQSILPKSPKIQKPVDWVGEGEKAFDIGPKTFEKYAEEIKKAKTIIWNGPVGKFEDEKYRKGSEAIAKAVAESGAFSIVGGGETTQLILELGLRKKIGFLSTGGGAMLEFLSGKKLPGIEALR